MAEFPEVTLRFISQSRGDCLDKKAKIIHGYIVSEKYNVVFPLPSEPVKFYELPRQGYRAVQTGKGYFFTEDTPPLDQDSNFINNFLVKVYQDAKAGKLR